jgi:anti-anti-sigma factor
MLIRVKGEATAQSCGSLLAGLLSPSACRPTVVTLDLSELRSISCLALGVLVAYRRGVVRNGGRVFLAEALHPPVKEALVRAQLFDFFETAGATGPAPNRQSGPAPLRQAM